MADARQTVTNSWVDAATIAGDGSVANPLRVISSGGGGSVTPFQYVVTGLEPDPMNLTIPLPVARASTDYGVIPAQADCAAQLGMNVANASRTLADFVLTLSAPVTAGDIFTFIVGDL